MRKQCGLRHGDGGCGEGTGTADQRPTRIEDVGQGLKGCESLGLMWSSRGGAWWQPSQWRREQVAAARLREKPCSDTILQCEYTPRLVKYFEGVKVKRVAAGMLHSACITEDGALYVFGERISDKLGFGGSKSLSTPSAVQELPYSEEVACGGYHTCVLTSEGSLCTWGSNENGCLGLGCTDMVQSPEDVKSSLFKFPISEVSCGWKHTAAISGGNVFTWGWGGANGTFSEEGHSSGGQLGHGDDVDYFEPMIVNISRNLKALHVSCGFNHTAGIFEHTEV